LKQGAEQADRDINEGRRLLGKKFSSRRSATTSAIQAGVSVRHNFVTAGVKFVVALQLRREHAGLEIYQENNILEITPASTIPRITERKCRNTLSHLRAGRQQGNVAGEYIAKHFKDKKPRSSTTRPPYGQGLADETRKP